MEAHPAADLFPLMQGDEFNDLVEDIREHGQREAVVTYRGQLLDGRNRVRACEALNMVPITREWDGQGSAVALVISLNVRRRHLTAAQRAVVAAKAEPMFAEENRKRQADGGAKGGKTAGRGRAKASGQSAPKPKDDTRSTTQAAKAVGAGTKATKQATSVRKNAPDVFAALESGAISTVSDAVALSKLPEEQREEALGTVIGGEKNVKRAIKGAKRRAAVESAPVSDATGIVEIANIRSLRLDAESVDMVFTDPPYHDEHVELYRELSKLSAHALKPGALCLAYAGKMYLPQILEAMAQHLEYVWQFIVFHPFSTTRSNSRAIFENYRPILVFRKPGQLPHASERPWVQDVVRGRREKDHHDWQQDEDAPRMYIDAYTKPGDLVLDPFTGGGTTAAVCKSIGRRFAVYDADEGAVKQTLARLATVERTEAAE